MPQSLALPHHAPRRHAHLSVLCLSPQRHHILIVHTSSSLTPHRPTYPPLSSFQEIFVEAFAAAAYQTTEAERRKLVSYNDVYQAVQTGASRGQDLEFLEGIIPPQSHPAN